MTVRPSPRRYVVDATPLLGRPTGIGEYARHVVLGVRDALRDDEALVLHAGVARLNPLFGVSHDVLHELADHERVELRRQWWPLRLSYAAWNRGLPPSPRALVGAASVFHGTNYQAPPLSGAAHIVTVHDLAPLIEADAVPDSVRDGFGRMIERAVADAHLVTPSAFTRDVLLERYSLPAERITVIPLGVDPRPWAEAVPETRDRPYLLALGTTQPRKNLPRLIRTFARARLPVDLLIAGDEGFDEAAVQKAIGKAGPSVVRLAYVPRERARSLVRGALALVHPAVHEGFGLPLLEAMAAGTPVLAGDRTALPEVAGDAALLVDPTDDDALVHALRQLVEDEHLRAELVERGRARVRAFPWSRTARAHLDLWRRSVAAGSARSGAR